MVSFIGHRYTDHHDLGRWHPQFPDLAFPDLALPDVAISAVALTLGLASEETENEYIFSYLHIIFNHFNGMELLKGKCTSKITRYSIPLGNSLL